MQCNDARFESGKGTEYELERSKRRAELAKRTNDARQSSRSWRRQAKLRHKLQRDPPQLYKRRQSTARF